MSPTKQDDETAKDSTTPDFLKGIAISPEEEQAMEDAAYSGAADDIAAREGLSGEDLKEAEENPSQSASGPTVDPREGSQVGSGYREEGKGKPNKKKSGGLLKRNGKKISIGAAIGSFIAGIVMSMLLLLPLKVQHIVNNLQNHFYASSEQATDKMTDALFRQYIVKKVVPSMYKSTKCTTTKANKSCVSVTPGDGPVAQLYNAWRDKNFEGKLAENQGIEIRKDGNNKFSMRKGNMELFSGVFDERNPKLFEGKVYEQMNRTEVRREMKKSFQNETFAKRIMYRYKVGLLLEKKYGIKRCLVACETRDKRQENREDRKAARSLKWKYYFLNKITTPRAGMYAIAFQCALGNFSCTASDTTDNDGQRTSALERDVRARIVALGLDAPDSKKLADQAESIKKKGVTGHIVSQFTNDLTGKIVGGSIPILGWITSVSQIVGAMQHAAPALKKINYVVNSQSMVTMYMMYRTNADEIKSGQADAADIGIVADSLGPDAGTDQNGAGAEESPIYQEIMGTSSSKTASLLGPKVQAFNGYKCNDGSLITSGVCPEVVLTLGNFAVDLAGVLKDITAPLGPVANIINGTIGSLLNTISGVAADLVMHLPGVSQAVDQLEKLAEPLIANIGNWFATKTIKDVIGEHPSGGRNMELAGGGADVSGNIFAHYGLGAHKIPDSTAAEIRAEMRQQDEDNFKHESTFARVFDTSSQYSVVSKMALALPSTTTNGTMRSFAGSLLNPFATLTSQFGGTKKADAASSKDPYGVTQYGYDSNDPVFQEDPEVYWSTHDCSNPDKAKNWGEAEKDNVNPDTGMPENDTTNGCKLIEASTGMAGAMYDDSLLSQEELGDQTGNSSGSSSIAGGSLTVGTYNTLRETDDKHAGAACANLGMTNTFACSQARAKLQARIISGDDSTNLNNPKFDVVMINETTDVMFSLLKAELAPRGYEGVMNREFAVFWNTQTMNKVDGGTSNQWSGGGRYGPTPWVGLRMTSGQMVYAMPLHYSSYPQFNGSPAHTREAAQKTLDWVNTKADDTSIVLTGGDIGLNWQPAIDVFNSSGVLQNTSLLADGKPSTGQEKGRGVDHIFVAGPSSLKASGWTRKPETGIISQASDHAPVYVTLSLPAGPAKVGTSVMGDDYKGCSATYGICGGQCVDFVKFRLVKHVSKYHGEPMGNGDVFAASIGRALGYKVDHAAAVYSVVSWPAGGVEADNDAPGKPGYKSDEGEHANSSAGHVAMVAEVKADGSIVVEEYNVNPGQYGTRTIPANVAKLLTYAHTEVDYK